MALKPDDTVCFCFHVTLRKVESYCRIEKPAVPSLISQCLSAGTGCGWCVPMLRRVHQRICGTNEPWWRKGAEVEDTGSANLDDAEAYMAGREKYLEKKKHTP